MNQRVGFIFIIAAFLLSIFTFAATAQAQTPPECGIVDGVSFTYNMSTGQCDRVNGAAVADPGRFTNAPEIEGGENSPSADVIPEDVDATAEADETDAAATAEDTAAPALAFTGAESEVLAYIGSGMIALGAMAFIAQRRISND